MTDDRPWLLTDRERDVLRLVAQGMTDKEIACRLGITTWTASAHVKRILGKLGVDNRTQAAVAWQRAGVA